MLKEKELELLVRIYDSKLGFYDAIEKFGGARQPRSVVWAHYPEIVDMGIYHPTRIHGALKNLSKHGLVQVITNKQTYRDYPEIKKLVNDLPKIISEFTGKKIRPGRLERPELRGLRTMLDPRTRVVFLTPRGRELAQILKDAESEANPSLSPRPLPASSA